MSGVHRPCGCGGVVAKGAPIQPAKTTGEGLGDEFGAGAGKLLEIAP